jgi:hypothetical protein
MDLGNWTIISSWKNPSEHSIWCSLNYRNDHVHSKTSLYDVCAHGNNISQCLHTLKNSSLQCAQETTNPFWVRVHIRKQLFPSCVHTYSTRHSLSAQENNIVLWAYINNTLHCVTKVTPYSVFSVNSLQPIVAYFTVGTPSPQRNPRHLWSISAVKIFQLTTHSGDL